MLTLVGPSTSRRHCDGVSRRDFVRIGALGLGGLSLAQLLAIEEAQATDAKPAATSGGKRHKSLIMVYLCGGPPHQDMYDLKVNAPAEIRGEFNPIPTNVPGIEVCELLPNMARIMDKLVPIRTVVGCKDDHASYQCCTGHLGQNAPAGGWPHIGSSSSRLQGPAIAGIPPFVSLCYVTQHKPYNEPSAGFLGLGHNAFRPMGEGRDDLVLQGITADRLGDRKSLLSSVDQFRRQWDGSRTMDGLDTFTQRAMGILTSSQLFDALDITKEDQKTRDRYGFYNPSKAKGDGRRACRRTCCSLAGWSKRAFASLRLTTASGIGTGRISKTPRTSCRSSIRRFRPSSKTCTSGDWPTTAPSSPGASSAARQRSIRTPAAIIGRASLRPDGRRRA